MAQNAGKVSNEKKTLFHLKQKIEKIRDEYGVDIYYDEDFLVDAKGNRIAGNSARVKPAKALQAVAVIEAFLKAYPVDFVRKNIGSIFMHDGLTFNQQSVGGLSGSVGDIIKRGIIIDLTNSDSGEFSSQKGEEIDFEFTLKTLHHEFAHNLLVQYQNTFPLKEWIEVNESDFKYYGNGYAFMKEMGRDGCLKSDDDVHRRGFIKGYSQASIEEDVATMAEAFYTEPKKLSKWIDIHPRLAQKVRLLDYFYRSIGAK